MDKHRDGFLYLSQFCCIDFAIMTGDYSSVFSVFLHQGAPIPQNSPRPSKSRRDQFCKVFPDIAETDEVIKCKSGLFIFFSGDFSREFFSRLRNFFIGARTFSRSWGEALICGHIYYAGCTHFCRPVAADTVIYIYSAWVSVIPVQVFFCCCLLLYE